MADRIFGDIDGIPEGSSFESRQALHDAGLHGPTMAGIWGTEKEGAGSIVMSGGFEDDEDYGDLIIYTGHGGQDTTTGAQIADQEFTRGNRALCVSSDRGLPVRVVRGHRLESAFAPETGFRYDGLYSVVRRWRETGRSGFQMCRFRMEKISGEPPKPRAGIGPPPKGDEEPAKTKSTVMRTVRDTAVGRWVKEIHGYRCQVCGEALKTPSGVYAEAAHLRPLGRPHNGPDVAENILCLCPNHHVQIDKGYLGLTDDLRILGLDDKPLRVVDDHDIGLAHVQFHRAHIYEPTPN
jgi:putative restriction endonuclease